MYKVYKHTAPNGKVYIGITSQKPEYRWDNGNGYKSNVLFYRAIQKYGWENFKHEILYDGLTKEEACITEIELIEKSQSSNLKFGYNLMRGGEIAKPKHSAESIEKMRRAKLGKKLSAETRKKISESNKGRICDQQTRVKISIAQKGKPRAKHTEEWKRETSERQMNNVWNMKAVNQFTKSGLLVASFISAKQAERETGCDNRNIIAVCRGKRKTAYGYVWKYCDAK